MVCCCPAFEGFPSETDEEMLRNAFSVCGEIVRLNLPRGADGMPKGEAVSGGNRSGVSCIQGPIARHSIYPVPDGGHVAEAKPI